MGEHHSPEVGMHAEKSIKAQIQEGRASLRSRERVIAADPHKILDVTLGLNALALRDVGPGRAFAQATYENYALGIQAIIALPQSDERNDTYTFLRDQFEAAENALRHDVSDSADQEKPEGNSTSTTTGPMKDGYL